jgi:chaperone modulatory protein CbpM
MRTIRSATKALDEISDYCGVSSTTIVHFIEEEWIYPANMEQQLFDEEDVSRILLIQDLKEKFGVNDEGVPLILHLIDQINFILHKSESLGDQ